MSARNRAIAAVSRAMVAARVPRWLGRWRDAAIVLSYHNVIADGGGRGERVLHVSTDRFREQIERIAGRFRPVTLGELLQRQRQGRSLRGLAAVTFDDAYRGVLRHALPILAELGVPATIFVISSALARDEPFWWDRLADGAGGIVRERDRMLTDFAGEEARIPLPGGPVASSVWDDAYLAASADELARLDRSAVSLGLHTMTHPNLTRVSGARVAQEIDGCWRALRERFGHVLPAIAYPYGAVNERVAAAAIDAGLDGFGGSAGPLTGAAARGRLPRLFVGPGVGADALEMAAAGLRLG